MKKHIFALFTMTSAIFGATLHGDESFIDLPRDTVENIYVSGFAGVNFLQNFNRHKATVKSDAGYLVGAAVGYRFENMVRVEAEFAYRNNGVKNFSVSKHIKRDNFSGKRNTTYSYMANVYYDFAIACDVANYIFTPYLGAGIGYAHNRASGSSARNFETSVIDNGVTYSGMGGITHVLSEKAFVNLEYKYFVAKHDIKDHSVSVNLKRYF